MAGMAIHTDLLSKSYEKGVYALQDLSVDVPEGEVFGFLGPNGAGKTTTVKLLIGLLKPTKGTCTVMGFPSALRPTDVHRMCGIVTESARMYGQLTGRENLMFFAEASGMSREKGKVRAEELLKSMELTQAGDKKLRDYSTGMTQRLSLARALISRPKVLFLDEPTSGLDPENAQAVNSLISSLSREEGVTVFLCTHQLRYAQDICSRYGILEKGSMLACGTLESLSHSAQIYTKASIRLKDGDEAQEFTRAGNGWWQKEIAGEEEMPALLQKLFADGHEIYEARLLAPTLEDVYFRYVQIAGEEVLS